MAIQPTGDQNPQPRRRDDNTQGKIHAFLAGKPADEPSAEAAKPISWQGVANRSADMMNGASVVYAMTRMLIGPTSMPPRAPIDVVSAPTNNMELPTSLPKPGKKKKLSGGSVGGAATDGVSGEPPAPNGDDETFKIDKAQFEKWREGMLAMDAQRQQPHQHRRLGL